MNEEVELQLDWCPPIGKGRKGTVVATLGDAPFTDNIDITSAKQRDEFALRLTEKWSALKDSEASFDIAARLEQLAAGEVRRSEQKVAEEANSDPIALLAATPNEVRRQAEEMLASENLIDLILNDIESCGVVGEKELALTVYVVGTSRLLDRPLAAIIQGPSSSGKSYVQDKVAGLFPDEAILMATDITAQALYYLPPGSLQHRFVIAGERARRHDDNYAEATRALREILSSGKLDKVVTVFSNSGPEALQIHQEGPIAYVDSTTAAKLFDEDANRCLLLATDESVEQTRAVMHDAARRAQGAQSTSTDIVERHRALQRMLHRVDVVIPFAAELQAALPSDSPHARRAFSQVLNMIRAVTLLHQRQRADGDLREGDTISATIGDYVVARRLLVRPIARALGNALPPAVHRFGQRQIEAFGQREFTSAECAAMDRVISSRSKVNEYLSALADVGAAEQACEHKGNKPARWRMSATIPDSASCWLPKADESGVIMNERTLAYA